MKVERSQRANTGEWVVTFMFDNIDLAGIPGSNLKGLYEPPDVGLLSDIIHELVTAKRREKMQRPIYEDPFNFMGNSFRPEDLYSEAFEHMKRRARQEQAQAEQDFNFNPNGSGGYRSTPPRQPSEPGWAKILGVPATASQAEIKAAYRKLAMKHHPDKGGDPVTFNKINQAYKEASG